jgi:hypothetical protein
VKSSSKGRPEHLTGQAEGPFASVCLFCRSARDLRWSRRVGAGYTTPAGPIRIVWKMDSEWLLDGREGTSCQFPEGSGRHRPASWLPMARTGSIHARDNQPCACCSLREHAVLPTQVKHFVKCPSVGERWESRICALARAPCLVLPPLRECRLAATPWTVLCQLSVEPLSGLQTEAQHL